MNNSKFLFDTLRVQLTQCVCVRVTGHQQGVQQKEAAVGTKRILSRSNVINVNVIYTRGEGGADCPYCKLCICAYE